MASYQIGQIRYNGSGCISELSSNIGYQDVSVGGAGATATSFKDVVITPATEFLKNRDYYLRIQIPQDMNYDLSFNIKLIKKKDNLTQVYQFLKPITILRGGTGENVYNVALYEKSNGEVAATIPQDYDPSIPSVKDMLYYNKANSKFYLGLSGGRYQSNYAKYNNIAMLAAWKEKTGENYGVFELVFRPVEDSFNQILIEMIRTAEDYNIQRIDETGKIEFGRKVDINKIKDKYQLYLLENLVGRMNEGGNLSRIGVWGHPGLMMSINGEEIKVGPSGYYELDALPISSLGIVARNYMDNFTIDYEYDTEIEKGGING